MKLSWNVFLYDFNSKEIRAYNIFDHSGFAKDIEEILSLGLTREGFDSRLRKELLYYFWCKSEYEIILTPWIGDKVERKVDAYTQVEINWQQFSDYVWNHRNNK